MFPLIKKGRGGGSPGESNFFVCVRGVVSTACLHEMAQVGVVSSRYSRPHLETFLHSLAQKVNLPSEPASVCSSLGSDFKDMCVSGIAGIPTRILLIYELVPFGMTYMSAF